MTQPSPALETAKTVSFLNVEELRSLSASGEPSDAELEAVLGRAAELRGLSSADAAVLLAASADAQRRRILDEASKVKREIYGKRMVIFAPLYTGNSCSNNCLYCGFRRDNRDLQRVTLSEEQIACEVKALLDEGHKRILLLCGETTELGIDHITRAIRTAYAVKSNGASLRRINVEVAPMTVPEFRLLAAEKIGTYTCFQETYDPDLYRVYHPEGPKADYLNRLSVMDLAMEAGIGDVGIGALFGLADYRFEVLALIEHARHLEATFGCGPHTVSVPRIEPAPGSALASKVPHPVSDEDFKKLVAVIRLSLPYTGIILSTRESAELRNEVFAYGVSQISAGSRTNPGGYSRDTSGNDTYGQFHLGDHRSLDEVISSLVGFGYVPSFCTGCYRKGRVGNDFMDLAKPGLIKQFCLPNGLMSFAEYLHDYAAPETKERGFRLVDKLVAEIENPAIATKTRASLAEIAAGKRDIYY